MLRGYRKSNSVARTRSRACAGVLAPLRARQESALTSYSVLRSGSRATVVATWSGGISDLSANVTTVPDLGYATSVAWVLTRLSEDAWDAAAFLDTHPVIEAAVSDLVVRLRSSTASIEPIILEGGDDYRHTDEWSHVDLVALLSEDLPRVFGSLTRTQRLTVADEIATDAAARAEALRTLPTGMDPDSGSRVWQMCEVTRSTRNGDVGPLPEGAAGWMVQGWGPERSPARRWGSREQLVRIEQLAAACMAHGGRGGAVDDPLEAHLVIPNGEGDLDSEIFYVRPKQLHRGRRAEDPFAPMLVTRSWRGEIHELGQVLAVDDDGFAKLLGEWIRVVPFLRSTDTFVDPATWE